jgi:hypothetical protein
VRTILMRFIDTTPPDRIRVVLSIAPANSLELISKTGTK